jgi:methionyl aminopeptidase
MITKNPEEINNLREGGRILATVLSLVASKVKPGISAAELDELADKEIVKAGGRPSFKNYRSQFDGPAFPAALCVSVNDEVVHGIPHTDKILEEGDIVGLDIGMEYKGLYTDTAITVPVGKVEQKDLLLIKAAAESLDAGLAQVKPGNYTGDIGHAIESVAKSYKFQVVRELVGHGVGNAVHEEPEVPCFGKPKTGTKLIEGMVLAIEPMVNQGTWKINFADDKWTIITEDGSWSAHKEHTILVTKDGCEILTNVV